MRRSVSIPEKTLEHWSSQYVAYRYRAQAALWWPSAGEDIDIRWLPTRPGKAVQLELKTTTVAGADLHDVMIDLRQLWEYRQRPLGNQPFYVFPWPTWRGELAAAANADGHPVTEFGFSRSGSDWWFADWMVVVTAAQVANVLKDELAAHGSQTRRTKKRLVRFDLSRSPATTTWGAGTTPPDVIRWLDLWKELEQCGQVGWPQLIRLPTPLTQAEGLPKRSYTHSHVIELLQQAADLATFESHNHDKYVTLTPDADGSYQIAADVTSDSVERHVAATGEVDDHRQVVFLDAKALFARNRSACAEYP